MGPASPQILVVGRRVVCATAFSLAIVTANAETAKRANPSFDCAKASKPDERVICSDDRLAELDQAVSIAFAQAARNVPQFKDFPAAPQPSPTSPLNWAKELLLFQTRIANAAKQKANFAGHYVLASWGCGTSCVTGAVINKLNGQIIPLPFSICCATPKSVGFKPIEFRLTSRLIVFSGLRNEEKPMGSHFYEFNGTGFKFIMTVPDDGSFSGSPSPNQESASSNSANTVPDRQMGHSVLPPLKQGMPYVEARKALIEAGWQAPKLPANGYDEKSNKVTEECSGDVAMCNNFPEIENCSGQGYCLMEFENKAGSKLEVTTYGELNGDGADATVTGWRREPP